MAIQIIPCGMLLLGGVFLHESPLWLFRNDRDEEGTKALEEIRQLPRDHKCKIYPYNATRVDGWLTQYRYTRRYTNDPKPPYGGIRHRK